MSRVLDRLEELYAIGATRIGYSPEEDEAHRLAARWLEEAGLEVEVDEAGNTFGRRGDSAVWTGSHLDTVPRGGRFDGALGVVGAIEAATRTTAPLAVVAFRDEERAFAGSRACVAAGRLPAAFVELHIEQGPVLERANAPLGIVTGVFGHCRGEAIFEGRADHAGTTPMDARRDALVEAAEFVLRVRAAARRGTVATVGQLVVEPGAPNVVPASAAASFDARAPTSAGLDDLVAAIGVEPLSRVEPVAFGGAPLDALRAVLPGAPELISGAGHDAAILAGAGVPTAMIFVRSLNGGVSHSPDELSSEADIELGISALVDALDRIGR
jgi:acetylornithine deacetylase/succinyl-diaminopimelate desuccinylase-like protein